MAEIVWAAGSTVTAEEPMRRVSVDKAWSDVREITALRSKFESARQSEPEEDAPDAVMAAEKGAGYRFPGEALSVAMSALAGPGSSTRPPRPPAPS